MPIEGLESFANVEVGEILRRTRLRYGRTLGDVERALRIRGGQIDAIEQGDMTRLPGRVYAIGFVRSYAEYLGLDGNEIVRLFKVQYMDGQINAALSFPVPASETKTPAVWIVILTAFLSCLYFVSWDVLRNSEYSVMLRVQNVPDHIKSHVREDILVRPSVSDVPDVPDVVGIFPDTGIVIENMKDNQAQRMGIILNIIDSSWVEIKNGAGDIVVSDILEKGEQYFVPDSPGLSMSLGNAANVEIILNGRPLKPLGKGGAVRRDIPLDTVYLKTLEFQDSSEEALILPDLED